MAPINNVKNVRNSSRNRPVIEFGMSKPERGITQYTG